jgi:hypothetical protein
MAIYFPSLFCNKDATLKSRRNIQIQVEDGSHQLILAGKECVVEDIIGYCYNIREVGHGYLIRIMNSSMVEYFEIIKNSEVINDIKDFDFDKNNIHIVILHKDFEIKEVVKIKKGEKFFHLIDNNQDTIFHELFSVDSKKKTLRMKDSEFAEYFVTSKKL